MKTLDSQLGRWLTEEEEDLFYSTTTRVRFPSTHIESPVWVRVAKSVEKAESQGLLASQRSSKAANSGAVRDPVK